MELIITSPDYIDFVIFCISIIGVLVLVIEIPIQVKLLIIQCEKSKGYCIKLI